MVEENLPQLGQGTLPISAQINSSYWEPQSPALAPQHSWLTRRRIAISILGFTSLVVFNMFIMRAVPYNPLAVEHLMVQIALLCLVVGLAIRSWSAGTLNKSRQLTTVGPYSLVRNPLYVGSFCMMIGFCILIQDALAMAFVAGPMSVLYWHQVRFEEQRLSHLFPAQWSRYSRATPRFFPIRISRQAWTGWSLAEWLRNREYKAIGTTAVGVAGIWLWFWIRTHS